MRAKTILLVLLEVLCIFLLIHFKETPFTLLRMNYAYVYSVNPSEDNRVALEREQKKERQYLLAMRVVLGLTAALTASLLVVLLKRSREKSTAQPSPRDNEGSSPPPRKLSVRSTNIGIVVAVSLSLLASVACLPQVRQALFVVCIPVLYILRVPLDYASSQIARTGDYQEFRTDDPTYDVLIYYFNGAWGKKPIAVENAGIKAIRKRGFRHTKKMTLIVFCNLTTKDKSHKVIYPYGLFLKSSDLRNPAVPINDLTKSPLITSPMNWDERDNEWIYSTNTNSEGPKMTENPNYTKPAQILEMGWFMDVDKLKTRSEVLAKFGQPKYLVQESGKYSEVYAVDDLNRNQTGTVRVWYEADKVTKTTVYMENK